MAKDKYVGKWFYNASAYMSGNPDKFFVLNKNGYYVYMYDVYDGKEEYNGQHPNSSRADSYITSCIDITDEVLIRREVKEVIDGE